MKTLGVNQKVVVLTNAYVVWRTEFSREYKILKGGFLVKKVKLFITIMTAFAMLVATMPTFAVGNAAEEAVESIVLASAVSTDFTLPADDGNGGIFTWQSEDNTVILVNGTQAIVAPSIMEKQVNLKVTASKNGYTATRDFPVKVVPLPIGDVGKKLMSEDFEDVTPGYGNLPADTVEGGGAVWRQHNYAGDTGTTGYINPTTIPNYQVNEYLGVAEETAGGNRALKIKKTVTASSQKYRQFAHANFDYTPAAPVREIIKYRYKAVSATSYINNWFTSDQGNNVGGGNALRGSIKTDQYIMGGKANSPAYPTTANKWYTVLLVANGSTAAANTNTYDLYINGSRFVQGAAMKDASSYIRRVFWGPGDTVAGEIWVDDVEVYDAGGVTWWGDVNDLSASILSGVPLNMVENNLTLPATENGLALTWVSSNPAVLEADGTVTQPVDNTNVKLWCVAEKDGFKVIKEFNVTVLSNMTDAQKSAEDCKTLTVPSVIYNYTLSGTGSTFGSTIAWVSSEGGVIGANNAVERGSEDVITTLTATVTKGSGSTTKSFKVLVPKAQTQDILKSTAVADAFVRCNQTSADTNYGNQGILVTDPATADTRNSYIRFDLSSDTGFLAGEQKRYTLKLTTGTEAAAGRTFKIYGLTGDLKTNWAESTLTYNMANALGLNAYTDNLIVVVAAAAQNTTYEIDITDYANSQTDGIFAFKLAGESGIITVQTKEVGNAAYRPAIQVERNFNNIGILKPAFYANGTELTSITSGEATAKANFINFGTARKITLITALYQLQDGIPKLQEAYTDESPVTAQGENFNLSRTINIPDSPAGLYYAKTFLWESSDNLKPISQLTLLD